MKKHKLHIAPLEKTIEVFEGQPLFQALKDKDIPIGGSCGGFASCGKCIIKVVNGKDKLNAVTFEEKQLLGNTFHLTKERLACQCTLSGDLEIDISHHLKDKEKKKSQKISRRKKVEVDDMMQERQAARDEKKNQKQKKEGGMKRPKAFSFHNEEKKE